MRHIIPLNTLVSFKGQGPCFRVVDYHNLLMCSPDCDLDHDHYREPFITVRQETTLAFPLSQLEYIFDGSMGRKPSPEESMPHD